VPALTFEEDIVQAIEQLVPVGVRGRDAIASMSATEAWDRYANWTSRLVEMMPRKVLVSRELESALPNIENKNAVRKVLQEIARGEDLRPRLSKLTMSFYDETPTSGQLHKRQDLDLLLNDWGIHHLHLGEAQVGTFSNRSKNLLFVSFVGANAYVIDVLPHNDWVNERLLKVIAENWPGDDAGVIFEAKGIVGLAEPVAAASRRGLRGAGVSVLFEYNGTVYLPRGGLTTGGTSMHVGMRAMQDLNYIWRIERLLEKNCKHLDAMVVASGHPLPASTDWHLDVVNDMWTVHERTNGATFLLQQVEQFVVALPTQLPDDTTVESG